MIMTTSGFVSPFKRSIISTIQGFNRTQFEAEMKNKRDTYKEGKKKLLDHITITLEPTTTLLVPTFNPDKETMEYTILVPKINNKLEHYMDPSEYDMSTIQLDFEGMKNSNKINVSKRNNQVVYTSLLKLEKSKIQLQIQIETLELGLANGEEQTEETNNKSKDLENRVTKYGSISESKDNDQAQVELSDLKVKLDEMMKNYENMKTNYENERDQRRKLEQNSTQANAARDQANKKEVNYKMTMTI